MTEVRTWVEISRERLIRNLEAIRQQAGPGVILAPVVKADAYGHGAIQVARLLMEQGVKWLEVSCVAEGVALRAAGIESRVLVMGGVLPFEREAAFTHRLTPVVHTLEELAAIDTAPATVHLKIDTGMSRLGARATPSDVAQALRTLKHLHVEGLMSHFASSEDAASPQNSGQLALFRTYLNALDAEPAIVHMANSGGILRGAALSMVRPGIALYGYGEGTLPALRWYARLVGVKDIPAGATVGYNARFTAPAAMRIGVVAAGYADGVPHRLSTRGHLVVEGKKVPILGAVSMDLTTIDLTSAPHLVPGDVVTIIGEGQNARDIAETAGEICYSVLCGIGNRVHRKYVA